jgi:hypothetical protein
MKRVAVEQVTATERHGTPDEDGFQYGVVRDSHEKRCSPSANSGDKEPRRAELSPEVNPDGADGRECDQQGDKHAQVVDSY